MATLSLEYLQRKLKRSQLLDKKFQRIIKNAPAIGEDAETARLAGVNLNPNSIQDYREEFNRLLRSFFSPEASQSIADSEEFDEDEVQMLVENWIGTTEGVLAPIQGKRDIPISAVLRALRNEVDRMEDVQLRIKLSKGALRGNLWEGKDLSEDEQKAYAVAVLSAHGAMNDRRFPPIRNVNQPKGEWNADLCRWAEIDRIPLNLAVALVRTTEVVLNAVRAIPVDERSAADVNSYRWAVRVARTPAVSDRVLGLTDFDVDVYLTICARLTAGVYPAFMNTYAEICTTQNVTLDLEVERAFPIAKAVLDRDRSVEMCNAINSVIDLRGLYLNGSPVPHIRPRGLVMTADDAEEDGPPEGFPMAGSGLADAAVPNGAGVSDPRMPKMLPHEKSIGGGKYIIDMVRNHLLRSGIISVRYGRTRHHISIKKTLVPDLLRKIVEKVISGNTNVDQKEYSRLSDREAHLLRSLAKYIGLASAAGLPDKSNAMDEKLRTAMLEIQAGNTNEQLRREVIAMLRHLYSIGRISGGAFHGLILSLG
jgi:hypothetical protein